jgi:hypothetical protein
MSEFFREVDEEVRRDRAVLLWKTYWVWFVALAVLIVAATASWRYFETRRTASAETAGASYETAAQLARDGKAAEAVAALTEEAKTAPPGYQSLARLRAADAQSVADPKAAVATYDALAADGALDASLRDVARLRAAMLRVDLDDPESFEKAMAPLAAQSFAFHASIRELLALAALKAGDIDKAGRWLDQIIVDPDAPSSLRQRAQGFLGLVEGGKPVGK